MKKYAVLFVMVFYMTSIAVHAQSLGDLAKEEQKRREAVSDGTVIVLENARPATSGTQSAEAFNASEIDAALLRAANDIDIDWEELLELGNMLEQDKEAREALQEIFTGISDMLQEALQEMNASMKELLKDMSPEEKAALKKSSDDSFKTQLSIMDIQFNKLLNVVPAEEKKEYEKGISDVKKAMEDSYKKTLKELGLN